MPSAAWTRKLLLLCHLFPSSQGVPLLVLGCVSRAPRHAPHSLASLSLWSSLLPPRSSLLTPRSSLLTPHLLTPPKDADSLDTATSKKSEGAFYVWTAQEVRAALAGEPHAAELFCEVGVASVTHICVSSSPAEWPVSRAD